MAWALTLLHDPDTLCTYEDFAWEEACVTEDTQPPPFSTPSNRRTRPHNVPHLYGGPEPTRRGQQGTSTGSAGMDVDHDI
jgi:hypothetical protein